MPRVREDAKANKGRLEERPKIEVLVPPSAHINDIGQ
jgi:hypothetical protein